MVDVGGYRVHLYCIGNSDPTVIITGAGYSFDWSLVQPEVAKFTRICSYDHSGIAWSDSGPADTCSLRVAEVRSAVKNVGITGPYVLVGHSLGALVSRLYASKYPDEVVGMVIVDHAVSLSQATRLMGGSKLNSAPSTPQLRLPDPNAGFEKLPEHAYQLHVWANSQPGFSQIMNRNREMANECGVEMEAVAQKQSSFDGKPFIVLSQPATQQLHTELLSLSSNSKQAIAVNSGHYVMVDRPDVVINAIREVVEAVQNHTKLKH